MPGWVVSVLVCMLACAGCTADHRRVQRLLNYEQNDVSQRLRELAVPYRVSSITGQRDTFVFSDIYVPAPYGFTREPALYIPRMVLKMDFNAPGSAHVIRELTLYRPQMSIDWEPYGSNLDVLYYAFLLEARDAAARGKGDWVLDRLTIRGGFVNVPDEWLGRERLDIVLKPFVVEGVVDPESPVSVEELMERCAALFAESVTQSIAAFDREMDLLEQAVKANLAQFLSE